MGMYNIVYGEEAKCVMSPPPPPHPEWYGNLLELTMQHKQDNLLVDREYVPIRKEDWTCTNLTCSCQSIIQRRFIK